MKNTAIVNIKNENDFITILSALYDNIEYNDYKESIKVLDKIAILTTPVNGAKVIYTRALPSHYKTINCNDYLCKNNTPIIKYKSEAKGEIGDYLVIIYDKLNKKKQYISDPYYIVNITNGNYVCRLNDKKNHAIIRSKDIKFFETEKAAKLYIQEYLHNLNSFINDEIITRNEKLELIETLKSEIKTLNDEIDEKIKLYSRRNLDV